MQDHLQRHEPAQRDLPGAVDDAHAAVAQFADNLVARHSWRWAGRSHTCHFRYRLPRGVAASIGPGFRRAPWEQPFEMAEEGGVERIRRLGRAGRLAPLIARSQPLQNLLADRASLDMSLQAAPLTIIQ